MGGCCGKSASSGPTQTRQANDLGRQRSRREQNWAATGQIALRDGNLKELPASITSVGAAAKVLDATNNRLTTLPPSLAQLANLQRLVLASNQLTALPGLASLQKLKVLNVESNRLTQLPPELGSLPRLERLLLGRNALTALPPSLGQLTCLTQLTCGGNKLAELPPELGGAAALEELDASDNYLRGVPASLGSLRQLRALLLDHNQVTSMPAAVLGGCEALQTLSLHGNPITPEALQQTEGFGAFEARRRAKVSKQILGGAAHNLDEGIDRQTSPRQ